MQLDPHPTIQQARDRWATHTRLVLNSVAKRLLCGAAGCWTVVDHFPARVSREHPTVMVHFRRDPSNGIVFGVMGSPKFHEHMESRRAGFKCGK